RSQRGRHGLRRVRPGPHVGGARDHRGDRKGPGARRTPARRPPRRRHLRPDPRGDRSRPLHLESFLRQAGPRHRPRGGRSRCLGDARHRSRRTAGPAGGEDGPRRERPRHDGGGRGRPPRLDRGLRGSRRGLAGGGCGRRQDQEGTRRPARPRLRREPRHPRHRVKARDEPASPRRRFCRRDGECHRQREGEAGPQGMRPDRCE
ncbi:MAG: hypothetical protein FD152_3082, partial [Xanthobacteraceae bacterium]